MIIKSVGTVNEESGQVHSGYWDQSGSFGNEHEARGYFAEMCEMYQRVKLIRTETYEMDYGERMV